MPEPRAARPPIRLPRRGVLLSGAAFAAASALARPALAAAAPAQIALIEPFVAANAFQGVIMLGRGGRPGYARAFGFADIEARAPMRVDTTFAIASISKWLTTLSVLRLVEQGRLSLDAPITTWLPAYRADTGARVTLRRLLSNTSGLANPFTPAAKADPTVLTTQLDTVEAVRRYGQGNLVSEPGARFDYIFTNWIVVLAAIEAVTGRPYPEAMRAITLEPLGLAATGFGQPFAGASARSYRTVDPLLVWPNDRLDYQAAAGGGFSTALDLLHAAHRVYDRGFLKPASLAQLGTVEAPADDYALGGRVKTLTLKGREVRIAWQTGRTAGYRSVLAHRLDGKGAVVILNNTALSQKVLDDFAKALFAAA